MAFQNVSLAIHREREPYGTFLLATLGSSRVGAVAGQPLIQCLDITRRVTATATIGLLFGTAAGATGRSAGFFLPELKRPEPVPEPEVEVYRQPEPEKVTVPEALEQPESEYEPVADQNKTDSELTETEETDPESTEEQSEEASTSARRASVRVQAQVLVASAQAVLA